MMAKRLCALILVAAGALLLGAAGRAELTSVQSVYLLPMTSGMDQYLANRLTSANLFRVVTDARRADAVLTDQLGAGFERRMDDLFPPMAAAAAAAEAAEPPAAADASKEPADPKAEAAKARERAEKRREADEVEKLKRMGLPPASSFSRGRGNIFLVDVKTRQVLWSLYARPKRIMPDELDRTSAGIVERLKKDVSGKP
ncbi:MAG: hypothetical protein FJW31_18650 [Acidobacteria bacterium]|nr:hypothetical protein [Acidobacteriota bacterium]